MALEFAIDKREDEYTLKCKVHKLVQYYTDVDLDGNEFTNTTITFLLIPQDSGHMVMFYDAWLPSYEEETYECVGILLSPIGKPCRLGVRRKNKDYHEHHYMVMMTPDLEKEISHFCENTKDKDRFIMVNILPSSKEENFNV